MGRFLERASFALAFLSAVSILCSIALSQVLLALSLAALLVSGKRLQFPPLRLPLALFVGITVVAVLASGDARGGLPQLRKFFVFAMVLVIYSTFESVREVRWLVAAWACVALASAILGFIQYVQRRQEANTYEYLVDGRITGFESHWMTFGGQEMIVLLLIASYILFSGRRTSRLTGLVVLSVLLTAVTLNMTRCIFLLGVPCGLGYLIWRRRRILILAGIAVISAAAILAPRAIQERAISVFKPHAGVDSNQHRAVCRMVGWEMVKRHPWLGLGPEQIGRQFDGYVPATVPRPLPNGWYGHLHNIYLQYAAERGVFGLLALLWFIGKAALEFHQRLRQETNPEIRAVLHGAIAVILAVLAEGYFEYNLGDSEVLTLFLSVVACGYVAVRTTPASEGLSVSSEAEVCLAGEGAR